MENNKPNILFIMADQMAAPILPIYNTDSIIKMPNLMKLANDAVVFESAYCNSPLCAPSRFSLLSGQLASKIGAWDNAAEFRAETPTCAHYLRNLGYKTTLAGKMHFAGPDQLHGFEERLTTDIYPADFGWFVDWDNPELRLDWFHNMLSVTQAGPCVRTNQLDYDDEVVYKSKQYLFDHARSNSKQPFFLTVSLTHPHDPYTISEQFWNLYENDKIPLPTIQIEQEQQDPHSQRLLKVIGSWNKTISKDEIRNARRAYFGACSYVDAKIGELLETLQQCGLAQNTIIVFSGDHGDMLGERGLWYKMNWFEMSARVPLLVYAPWLFPPKRIKNSVSTIDLMPTLVELGGGKLNNNLNIDGKSLYSFLTKGDGHDEVFGEYMAEGTISPLMMIRRAKYKFIYSQVDPYLLYDLETDPHELHNLATVKDFAPILNDFIEQAKQKWDICAISTEVLQSQRRRKLIAKALSVGNITSWDYQPFSKASQQYVRNHIPLDDLERRARYPKP